MALLAVLLLVGLCGCLRDRKMLGEIGWVLASKGDKATQYPVTNTLLLALSRLLAGYWSTTIPYRQHLRCCVSGCADSPRKLLHHLITFAILCLPSLIRDAAMELYTITVTKFPSLRAAKRWAGSVFGGDMISLQSAAGSWGRSPWFGWLS